MTGDELKWLWKMSAPICRHEIHNQKLRFSAIRVLKRRLNYMAKAARLSSSLQVYMHPREGSPLQRAMKQRPELAGVVIWPYICSSWSAAICLQRIDEHFRAIEKIGAMLDFPVNEILPLLDLADVSTSLQVVLDQPKWLMREGLFSLNLFSLDNRIYSLSFSFAFEEGGTVAYIGGIQGVDVEGILGDYRDLTKALHGMRPRDFLVESFRTFCRCLGVTRIYAVDDAKRHLRSSYFGTVKPEALFLNYNDIWAERGGMRDSEDFFVLSMKTPMKSLDEVPSKKRAMYRRRYELLQSIEERMRAKLNVYTASQNNCMDVLPTYEL
jgi:uncharacterized protein